MNKVRRPSAYLFALALLAAARAPVLHAQAAKFEGLPVRTIQFSPAEQPLEAEELHQILPLQMNEALHMATVRSSIERLFATGRYLDIQVDAQPYRDGVAIVFNTKAAWFVGDVSATGDISSPPSPGQLENATGLNLGEPYTDAAIDQA